MTGHSVAMVVHEGVQALDVAGPMDVFAEANGFIPHADRYEITVVGAEARPMRASNGLSISPHASFAEAAASFGTVLVAGGPTLPDATGDGDMGAWLRDRCVVAARYGSVCTGAFALGRSGLLDGRSATTHWQDAPKLAAMFPMARVDRDRIYLRDGPLFTSAGVTAGIDLALALVAEDHGASVASSCAKRLIVAVQRQGGQSQFSPWLLPPSPPGSPLARVQGYVVDHLGDALSVSRLSEVAGVSARGLARLFASELDVTPRDYVEALRVDRARNLLEGTGLAIKVVAHRSGFGGAEQMRVVFQRRLGVSPSRYRASFGLPLREAPDRSVVRSTGSSDAPGRTPVSQAPRSTPSRLGREVGTSVDPVLGSSPCDDDLHASTRSPRT